MRVTVSLSRFAVQVGRFTGRFVIVSPEGVTLPYASEDSKRAATLSNAKMSGE